ncbi:MAG TPA: two-component sensor histidine kinase [Actinobacteria bacterium]|nr:two-component sensor histidine kinase [Actinomycetota bacterium]
MSRLLSATSRVLLAVPRGIRRIWRRSLWLRVTLTTLALSLIVVGVLGLSLLSRVTTGLLDAKERISVGEATAGLGEARRILDAADTGPSTPAPARIVDSVVSALATRAGSPATFDVLLLSSEAIADAPERGTNLVSEGSVPPALRAAVASSGRQSWTYTDILFLDGRSTPGLIVGAPLVVPTVGPYELYYLFPLTQEQETLDLVRSAVIVTGLLLLLLVAGVAWLVTRQVVVPVRAASRTAVRLADGNLSERMPVRGTDDLARLATSFNAMAASLASQIRQLEDLSRVQQRFVSDVSHELRTPLTTIRMAADVVYEDREQLDAPTERAVELLQNQLDRFEALLADLLEISRFDAGAAVLDDDRVDLVGLVQRAIDSAAPLADRAGLDMRLVTAERECIVMCDQRRVDRIVRNLLENAIEHGDLRGVDVRIAQNDEAAAVTVRDFGVGLRPGESSLVFNRFWRADPARARTTGGTGLGLAISLEDARLHGGWLEAWGEPGRGACFRLTLPRHRLASFAESPLPLEPSADDYAPEVPDASGVQEVGLDPAPEGQVPSVDAASDRGGPSAAARFVIRGADPS